jgi:hypothetical protein
MIAMPQGVPPLIAIRNWCAACGIGVLVRLVEPDVHGSSLSNAWRIRLSKDSRKALFDGRAGREESSFTTFQCAH